MNILFLYPWLELGGAPADAITLAKGLKDRGHSVIFFTRSGGIHEGQLKELGIPYVSARYSRVFPKLYHLNLSAYRKLRETIDRHSIDIVHAFHPYSYILALLAAPFKDVPVVFTSVWFLKEWKYPYYPGRVIFVAREFRDQAEHLFGGYPREVQVVPNRVDTELFHPGVDCSRFAERYSLPLDGWKVAFMSRISSTKINSLAYAIEAVRILHSRGRHITLGIAGDGMLVNRLKELADEANDSAGRKIIKYIGPVENPREFLSWADIVLGIGRCAWEGMACGKPTMIVGEYGLAGIVEPEKFDELEYHNLSGRNLKEPVSEKLLADAIERVMSDRSCYESLSVYSRTCAVENCDYRKGVERIEKMYERALNEPPLTGLQKLRVFTSSFFRGYLPWVYYAAKIHVNALLGRGKPEDFKIP